MDKNEYKLCYIYGQKAYFTSDFEHQWGDDWNDRPYEFNAGKPYDSWYEEIPHKPPVYQKEYKEHEIEIETLYFETNDWNEKQPCNMGNFSVEDINKQAVAWIHTDKFNIMAGTTMEDFIDIITKHGGNIWQKI